jgi:uncharacterized protein (DUF1330 family)
MKTPYTVVLSMIAGAALGGAAIQGLHAQAKPKAYQVTELEIIDEAAWQDFVKAVRASQQAASGRNLRTAKGKVVAFVGDPPKNVGITEFDSLDQAVAYRNSQAFKDLDPQRNKAIKIVRQYTVEVEN